MATFTLGLSAQYRLRLETQEQLPHDTANNTSVVHAQVYVDKLSGSGYYTYNTSYWSITIDGVLSGSGSLSGYDFRNYSTLTLGATSVTVTHNSDGSKTVSVAGGFNDGGGGVGSGDVSGSMVLSTIPRASQPTISPTSLDAGTSTTITTNRLSSSFTHNITYSFGSLSGQTAGLGASTGVTTSTTFVPPTSLLNEIPTALSGVGVITVATYNGASLVGTKTVNFTLTVPAAAVPTVAGLTVSEGTTSPDVATLIGQLVQNVSKVTAAASGISGVYGSSIVSTKITVGGQTIASASGTTASPITTSGTVAVVAETTDSRGRKGTNTVNVTVLPYAEPAAPLVDVRRATAAGVVDQSDGIYIRVDMSAVVQSLLNGTQKNLLQYRVSTSPHGADTWTTRIGPTTTGASTLSFNSYSGAYPYILLPGVTFSVFESFDVRVEILDELRTTLDTASVTIRTVATGAVLLDLNGASGVGFGKYHQNGMIDVAGDGYFTGDVNADGTGAFGGQITQNGGQNINDGTSTSADGNTTMYRDVFQWRSGVNGNSQDIVINTPLTFSSKMYNIHIQGYNHNASAQVIDLSMGVYPYSTDNTFLNLGFVNNGNMDVQVRFARYDTNKVQIILTPVGQTWSYPQFSVSVQSGFTASGRSFRTGWSAELTSTRPTLNLTYCSETPLVGVPFRQAEGKVSCAALVAGASADVSVTFPVGRFLVPPSVMVTSYTTRHNLQITEGSITTTGFTCRMSNWSGGTSSGSFIGWSATQMTSGSGVG